MEVRRAATHLQCAARHWVSDNASNTGPVPAFYCAFSLAPLLVILLTLAGLFCNEETAAAQVGRQAVPGSHLGQRQSGDLWHSGLYLAHSTQPSAGSIGDCNQELTTGTTVSRWRVNSGTAAPV